MIDDKLLLLRAKQHLEERINSLDNDLYRAYVELSRIGCAPFPITMYFFSMMDYISSYWCGSDESQTRRMSDFFEKYLYYPRENNQIAINLFRHKLMHTSEPRIIYAEGNKKINWMIDYNNQKHMQIDKVKGNNGFYLIFGIKNAIDDLKNGIFGPSGYFKDLTNDIDLQNKWRRFEKLLSEYKFKVID